MYTVILEIGLHIWYYVSINNNRRWVYTGWTSQVSMASLHAGRASHLAMSWCAEKENRFFYAQCCFFLSSLPLYDEDGSQCCPVPLFIAINQEFFWVIRSVLLPHVCVCLCALTAYLRVYARTCACACELTPALWVPRQICFVTSILQAMTVV